MQPDANYDTIAYNVGINADVWSDWRNSEDVGYIQLAFNVITEAIFDLIMGDSEDYESAAYFFFGSEEDSLYKFWATVLGTDPNKLPSIVVKWRDGKHISETQVNNLRNLCTVMKTI